MTPHVAGTLTCLQRGSALGALLLAIPLAGCGGRTSADDGGAKESADASAGDSAVLGFPVGTYENCAQGLRSLDSNIFFNTVGFVPGAILNVTQSGQTVTAVYVDNNGGTSSFDFVIATNTSATLAPAGQMASNYTGLCVLGVGVSGQKFSPAILNASAGALTYDSGAVFVSVTGVIESETEECGLQSSPASSWIICQNGPSQFVDASPPPPVPKLPVGTYECSSQIATFYQSGVSKYYVSSGEDGGTLTLTQTGAEATAQYTGDSFIAGTAHLHVTTATAASAEPDQSLMASCDVPIATGGLPLSNPEALSIASGSLIVNDTTLLLSFVGNMEASSSCPGAQKVGSLICSKQ